jgi:hypothetical protein
LTRLFSKEKKDSPKIGSDFAKSGPVHNLRAATKKRFVQLMLKAANDRDYEISIALD